MIVSILLTACFPAGASEVRVEETHENEIPASFDLRNVDTDGDGIGDRCYVTPVRFQNPFASCWAFAAIAAAETSLLGSVHADDPDAWKTLNLSEKQLAYFSHMLLNDPSSPQNGEGQTATDSTKMFDVYGGGSTTMAVKAFAQGIGPSDEHPDLPGIGEFFEYHGKERITVQDYMDGRFEKYHYSDEDDWNIPDEFRFHQDYVLADSHLLPSPAQVSGFDEYEYNEDGTTAIKQQLLQKRGVMISMLADASTPTSMATRKYISDNWAHYTWDFGSSNHSVTIIGWDDHYPKENFLADHQPPADGAWLVKNSWGSAEEAFPSYGGGNWGIENEEGKHTGYFWISYYDHSINEPIALELKAVTVPESVDQHDYFLPVAPKSESYIQPTSMANVFKADHSKTIHAISCMTMSANTSVHYQIYLLQDAFQTPEDGLMVAEGDTSFVDAGFHRIPISKILVQKDQYFSVVVTMLNQEGTYDVNQSNTYLDDSTQVVVVNERESYLRQNEQWQDYKTASNTQANESEPSEMDYEIRYDNFPIKVYSDLATNDVKMKLRHENESLSVMEGHDSDLYHLRFVAGIDFDAGKPSIVWQPLPGSEDIVEIEVKDEGATLAVTAKTPGTAMFSVTTEGIGTTVFPITVKRGSLENAMTITIAPEYTGQEVIPLVFVYSDAGSPLTEGVHYQVTYENNIRCGLGRAVITGIGPCADPDAKPLIDYFAIVPSIPEIVSLTAESSEIRLSVADLSDIGADGYEAQYRLKGTDDWTSVSFEEGHTDLVISSLAAGEYEVQVRAFVDNRDADLSDIHTFADDEEANADTANAYKRLEYGSFGDIRTIIVP